MDMQELLADLMPTAAAEGTENAAEQLEETETEQTADAETETETEEQSPEGDAKDEGEAKDEAEEDDKSKDDEDADEEKPKREPRSRRMKRQLEALRSENAALKAQREGTADKAPANPAPKFEDFNGDFDKYDSARIAWAAREAVREQQAAEREVSARDAQVELQQEMLQEFQASQERARKALPDFDQVLAKASNAPVAPHVGQL